MRLSRASGYAIRAVVYLASQSLDRRCEAQEIANHEQIPIQFLWKVLQLLCRRRLLNSVRGTGGGYKLAVRPEGIRLATILEAMGDTARHEECFLRFQDCSPDKPCVLHGRWAHLRREYLQMLQTTTVADLVAATAARREPQPASGERTTA